MMADEHEQPLSDEAVLDPNDLLAAVEAGSVSDLIWALQIRAEMGWSGQRTAEYVLHTMAGCWVGEQAALRQLAAAQEVIFRTQAQLEAIRGQLQESVDALRRQRGARPGRAWWAALRARIRGAR